MLAEHGYALIVSLVESMVTNLSAESPLTYTEPNSEKQVMHKITCVR